MSYFNYHRDGTQAPSHAIFVFGSNLSGIHGAGAARAAHEHYGAQWGVGEGLTGCAYALPTKDEEIRTLPIDKVQEAATRFLDLAWASPTADFFMTRVGCGLAGFTDAEIAPFFANSPRNIDFPIEWSDFIEPDVSTLTGLERYRPTMTNEVARAWSEDADKVVERLCVDLYEAHLRIARARGGKAI